MCPSLFFIKFSSFVYSNFTSNFIYRIVFICQLVQFNTLYHKFDIFHPGMRGPTSKPSEIHRFVQWAKISIKYAKSAAFILNHLIKYLVFN